MNRDDRDDERGIPDGAIDRVVREMLDVEQPAGFRHRVLGRIDESPSPWRWMWIAVPVAAAAVFLLAVLLPLRSQRLDTIKASTDYVLPIPPVAPPSRGALPPGHPDAAPSQVARRVVAATVDEPLPVPDEAAVAPLQTPPPIEVTTIGTGRSTPVGVVQVVPISLKPLEVNALDDSPQGRHEE